MTFGLNGNQAATYQRVGIQSEIESASPHRIIQLLMAGALDKMTRASACLSRHDHAAAGVQIGLAISIIDGLRMSLDKSVQSEIVTNLEDLYLYMGKRLLEANVHHDQTLVEEVSDLMKTIKSGWDEIAPFPVGKTTV